MVATARLIIRLLEYSQTAPVHPLVGCEIEDDAAAIKDVLHPRKLHFELLPFFRAAFYLYQEPEARCKSIKIKYCLLPRSYNYLTITIKCYDFITYLYYYLFTLLLQF